MKSIFNSHVNYSKIMDNFRPWSQMDWIFIFLIRYSFLRLNFSGKPAIFFHIDKMIQNFLLVLFETLTCHCISSHKHGKNLSSSLDSFFSIILPVSLHNENSVSLTLTLVFIKCLSKSKTFKESASLYSSKFWILN